MEVKLIGLLFFRMKVAIKLHHRKSGLVSQLAAHLGSCQGGIIFGKYMKYLIPKY